MPSSSNSNEDSLFQSPLTRLTRVIRPGNVPPNISTRRPPITQGVPDRRDQNENLPTPTAPLNSREAMRQLVSYLITFRASLADPIFVRKRPACPTWRSSSSKRRVVLVHRDLGSRSSSLRTRASALRTRTPPRILNAIPTVAVGALAEEALPSSPVSSHKSFSSRLLRAMPNFLFRTLTPASAPVEFASDCNIPVHESFEFTFTAPASVVAPSITNTPPSPSPSLSPSPSRPPPRKRARTCPNERTRKFLQERAHESPSPKLDPGAASSSEEDFYRCQALCERKFAEMEALSRRLDEVVGELRDLL